MSVLIKNMEMPECCYDCLLIRASVAGDYYCAAGNGIEKDLKKVYETIMPDCPLVEVSATRLMSLKPMRKKGKWVSDDTLFGGVPYHCNQCGEKTLNTIMGKPRWNFCPNCGAKMER